MQVPPRDHWVVVRHPREGYDPDRIELLDSFPDRSAAEAEAARLDALAGEDGPRHAVLIMAHLHFTEGRELT
jgi:hypothetical protein